MTFRDPPHYLRTLSTTSTPKRLLWLACRGYVTRRRDSHIQHFQAAALGRTHWTARRHERRDSLDTFSDPRALWDAVAAWCPKGRRVVLFTYDLAEQMRLSQMLVHMPDAGWTIDKIVLEATASWCLLRSGARSLMCCDLASWTPVTLDKISVDVHTETVTKWIGYAGKELPMVYVCNRVRTIRQAVLSILDWIGTNDLGQFRPTGSGQSFTAYRRRFSQHRLLVHDDTTRLAAERAAMHTGRAEAWRHGALRAGPYVEYDLHAAYATIGRDCEVPTRARGELKRPSVTQLQRAMARHAVLAQVTVSTEVECLPYAVNGRTVWPVGTFTTWLYDPELQLALDYCDKVRIHHAYTYTREPALANFCTYVLSEMENPSGTANPIVQRVLKHWSRCLVGRFGLRYREWIKFGPLSPPDVRLVTYDDIDEGIRTDMLHAGHECMILGELTEARESLPQIPGWIMSECRAQLWRRMAMCGADLVYIDTDSVIIKAQGEAMTERLFSGDPGYLRWDHKGTYNRMTIYGPRNLEVGHSRRVSGLPLSAKQTAPLEFTGEVMRGVKHAMRNGELGEVVSLPRTFHLSAPDLRHQHNPDGTTSPFRVEESCL